MQNKELADTKMIREAKQDDIPAIRAIMEAEPGFWQDTWRADVLELGLKSAAGLAFVCVDNERIIGFICGHDLGFRAYLSELVVAKTHRAHGIGKQLVAHLESELASHGCTGLISDVWKDARGFYESMGWSSPDVVLLRKKLINNRSQPSPGN